MHITKHSTSIININEIRWKKLQKDFKDLSHPLDREYVFFVLFKHE